MGRRTSLTGEILAALERVRDSAPVAAVRRHLYEREFAGTHEFRNLTRGLYHSFAEARRDAPATMPVGYALDDEAYARRDTIESHDYAALLWLGPRLERGCTVVDFGGHVGVQYYLYGRYLAYSPALRWVVCDQPHVTALGRALAVERGAPHLAFVDELAAAGDAEVFHTAGCIQFVEEPLADLLGRLPRRPSAVLVNKVPLYDRETRVTLQNTGRSFSPCYLFNAGDFIGAVEGAGYRLVDRWRCPDRSTHVPFHPDHGLDAYSGLYFETTAS